MSPDFHRISSRDPRCGVICVALILWIAMIPLTLATNMKCHYDKKNKVWDCDFFLDYIKEVGRTRQTNMLGIKVWGTDYYAGEHGKIFLQLLDEGKPVYNATCLLDLFSPDGTQILDDAVMVYLPNSEGIYYYDYIAPSIYGVYPLTAKCLYLVDYTKDYADSFTLISGSVIEGSYTDSWNEDRVYHTIREGYYVYNYLDIVYEFYNISFPSNFTNMVIMWKGEWTDHNEQVYMYLWNFDTSSWDLLRNRIAWYTYMVSNVIPNESVSAYLQNGTVRVRFESPVLTMTRGYLKTDLLELQMQYATYGAIEMVRGGGEVHVYEPKNIIQIEDYIEEKLIYNHNYCIDNTTLRKELLITKCIDTYCWNITRYEDTVCTYGCWEGKCNLSYFDRAIRLVLVLIGVLVLFVIIWKVVR